TCRPNPRGENRRSRRLCRHSIDRRVRQFRLYQWTLPLKNSEYFFLSKTQFYKIPFNSRWISFHHFSTWITEATLWMSSYHPHSSTVGASSVSVFSSISPAHLLSPAP